MTSEDSIRLTELLPQALADKYKEERSGLHVSDITLCPRRSVMRFLDPKPLTLNDMMYFISGESMHRAIQALARWIGRSRMKTEEQVEYKGVFGHIDAVIDGIICEFKSTRSKKHGFKKHYKEQLQCYQAMSNNGNGKLMSISITNFDQPFQVFESNMNNGEIKERLDWIEREGKQYKEAKEKKDWKIARCIKDDDEMNWLCRNCPYKDPCFDYENSKK